MKWKTLIATKNGKSISMSRFGSWLCFLLMLVASVLYFIKIINTETFKNIMSNWIYLFIIFMGYQGVSKVSKQITKNKDNINE